MSDDIIHAERRAVCLSIIRRGRVTCSVSRMGSTLNTKTNQLARGPGDKLPPDLPSGKRPLARCYAYLFTSGAGLFLASKVGSFLASAEGEDVLLLVLHSIEDGPRNGLRRGLRYVEASGRICVHGSCQDGVNALALSSEKSPR